MENRWENVNNIDCYRPIKLSKLIKQLKVLKEEYGGEAKIILDASRNNVERCPLLPKGTMICVRYL